MIISHQYLEDGGPVYAETNIYSFIVEPWNSISSLAIVIPAIYWAAKLKFNYKDYPFLFYSIPLLILGGLGSTLYHAFRNSEWLLYMDVFPTAVLTLSVGIYFWNKILKNWWQTAFIIIPITIFRISLFELIKGELAVNLSYFITGTLIFLPILIYLIKHNFRYSYSIIMSCALLSIALYFREIDLYSQGFIPIGTHFIWHILSGIGAYYLGEYLYLLKKEELIQNLH